MRGMHVAAFLIITTLSPASYYDIFSTLPPSRNVGSRGEGGK